MEWNQTFQGTIRSLVVTSDNGYAMAGYKDDDFWLAKTDANGNMQWEKTYGGTGNDRAYRMVRTSDGGYAIAGTTGNDFWLVKTDLSGNMQWNKTYDESGLRDVGSLVATSDGGYAIAGRTNILALNFVLVKTDEDGNMAWKQTYTGTLSVIPDFSVVTSCSMIETSHGGYALCGNSGTSNGNCRLIKTDEYGNVEWDQTCALTGYTVPGSLIETSDGGYAIAGNRYTTFIGSFECWLVKTD
jgi:hypothetical protein